MAGLHIFNMQTVGDPEKLTSALLQLLNDWQEVSAYFAALGWDDGVQIKSSARLAYETGMC